ncbi:hypothetical protein BS47DRAFT_1365833 [Hydnum rufescens UP504]|uniref:Uncharacterized protein n=1 Tax=Hydnum rufescens UP504 TaxID=1448309 RepID=A0A9P6AMS8_9AGAM|nr:hypothetical protein BS47DRAFT_1365833 [Hydnum rufescens UP504]
MTTHPQQWVCGHVRSWPGGSKEKPANDEGRTTIASTTRNPRQMNPLPETTTCMPPPNRNPPKPCQKTTRATRTTHLPKGCVGFQGCPSVPTTRTNRKSKTPNPPDKTWEQGCTTQDTRNARWNHTPTLAGVYHALRTPQMNHTPAAAGHCLNQNPPNERTPNEPPPPKQPTTE